MTRRAAKRILTLFVGIHVVLAIVPTALNVYGSVDPTLTFFDRIADRLWLFTFHLFKMPTLIFGLPLLAILLLVTIDRNT